jgi:hypothetical protein
MQDNLPRTSSLDLSWTLSRFLNFSHLLRVTAAGGEEARDCAAEVLVLSAPDASSSEDLCGTWLHLHLHEPAIPGDLGWNGKTDILLNIKWHATRLGIANGQGPDGLSSPTEQATTEALKVDVRHVTAVVEFQLSLSLRICQDLGKFGMPQD